MFAAVVDSVSGAQGMGSECFLLSDSGLLKSLQVLLKANPKRRTRAG